ncbi:hypothetical protein PGTUg99_000017, partial [Puccinia graminis f. sp. tritici]
MPACEGVGGRKKKRTRKQQPNTSHMTNQDHPSQRRSAKHTIIQTHQQETFE